MARTRVSRLEEWYGPERAARIRREQARKFGLGGGDVRAYASVAGRVGGPRRAVHQYAEFGAAPAPEVVAELSTSQKALLRARMEAALYAVNAALIYARAGAVLWPFAGYAEKQAVLSALNNHFPRQVEMRRASMEEVLAGRLAFDKWRIAVDEMVKGIANIMSDLNMFSAKSSMVETLSDIWDDVTGAITWVGKTAKAAGKVAQDVPEVLEKYRGLFIFGGVALGAFILYQYATSPLKFLPKRAE